MTTPTTPGATPATAPHAHTKRHDEHDAHAGHHAGPATEPEVIRFGQVITVGVLSVLLFAVGSVWAMKIRSATEASMNPAGSRDTALPAGFGAEEQGIVDQPPFELNRWVEKDRAEAAAKLKGYGWVDQQSGVIHVPIERAMELVVMESAK